MPELAKLTQRCGIPAREIRRCRLDFSRYDVGIIRSLLGRREYALQLTSDVAGAGAHRHPSDSPCYDQAEYQRRESHEQGIPDRGEAEMITDTHRCTTGSIKPSWTRVMRKVSPTGSVPSNQVGPDRLANAVDCLRDLR